VNSPSLLLWWRCERAVPTGNLAHSFAVVQRAEQPWGMQFHAPPPQVNDAV
jgi:hypothetical protein